MARYKDYNYDQMKMIPVSYQQQILPGSFEYSLSYLIDNELELSAFEQHYRNDDGGRPAYDPRLLLKIIILAYSKGITSSRRIEQLCRENIVFMALSVEWHPRRAKEEAPEDRPGRSAHVAKTQGPGSC